MDMDENTTGSIGMSSLEINSGASTSALICSPVLLESNNELDLEADDDHNNKDKYSIENISILDGKFFKVVSIEGIKVSAKCSSCGRVIKGEINSTSNFVSHLRRLHADKEFAEYKEYANENSKMKRKRTSLTPKLQKKLGPLH